MDTTEIRKRLTAPSCGAGYAGHCLLCDIAALLAALDKAERERNAYRALLVRVSRAWNTDPDDPGFYTEHDAAHEAITAALAAKDCPDAP